MNGARNPCQQATEAVYKSRSRRRSVISAIQWRPTEGGAHRRGSVTGARDLSAGDRSRSREGGGPPGGPTGGLARAPPLDPPKQRSTDSCGARVLTGVEQQPRGVSVRAVVGAVAGSAADEGIDGEVLGPRRHGAGSGGFHVRRHHRVWRPADSSYPCAAGLGRGPLVAPQAALGNASGRRGASRPDARPSPPTGAGGRARTPIGRVGGEGVSRRGPATGAAARALLIDAGGATDARGPRASADASAVDAGDFPASRPRFPATSRLRGDLCIARSCMLSASLTSLVDSRFCTRRATYVLRA
ncbi:hypothetical protein MRX96_010635 [Rhipicephalus microplus]